jgi:pimeloyl-ACP methyl ester carboxylesterase
MRLMLASCCLIVSACAHQEATYVDAPLSNASYLPISDVTARIADLSNCTRADSNELLLNSQEPVTVVVHGCWSSAGRFRSLADVFAFHGQQAICFSYDDRDDLTSTSGKLIDAIEELSAVLDKADITVIGHSQGGLVARRALIEERPDRLILDDVKIELATISAPFGGIGAADHCGMKSLVWLSLGLIKPICHLVTGRKYRDITAYSDFILQPGRLIPSVSRHVKIVTDEAGTCRVYGKKGNCIEDDFVFSTDEQRQPSVDAQTGLTSLLVKAGHVEIVGDANIAPEKLIGILQQQGILRPTPEEDTEALAQLLADLYLTH